MAYEKRNSEIYHKQIQTKLTFYILSRMSLNNHVFQFSNIYTRHCFVCDETFWIGTFA